MQVGRRNWGRRRPSVLIWFTEAQSEYQDQDEDEEEILLYYFAAGGSFAERDSEPRSAGDVRGYR